MDKKLLRMGISCDLLERTSNVYECMSYSKFIWRRCNENLSVIKGFKRRLEQAWSLQPVLEESTEEILS